MFPRSSSATFTGCTSRSVLCTSGLTPSVYGFCGLLVSLSHAGLQHRRLRVCVCAHLLLVFSRTASQLVTTLPLISASCAFSPILPFTPCPPITHTTNPPFTVFNILIKSVEDMFRASK